MSSPKAVTFTMLASLTFLVFVSILMDLARATTTSTGTSSHRMGQTVNRMKIDDSTGTVVIIAAIPGQRIQIWGATLATASASTMEFLSAANSLTGAMNLSSIQINPPFGQSGVESCIPWLETNVGEALNLNLGGAVQVTGQVIWTSAP